MHASTMPRDVAPPSNPLSKAYTVGGRAAYHEIHKHVFPRFRLPPHLLSPRPRPRAAAAAVTAAAVAECTWSRRAT